MNISELSCGGTLNWRAIIAITKIEFKVFFKTVTILFSQIATPIMYFMFIVFALNTTIGKFYYKGVYCSYQEYAFVGIMGISVISQMSRVIYRMTVDRKYGFFALKIQCGVRPLPYILAMGTSAVLGYITQSIVFFFIIMAFELNIALSSFIVLIALGIIVLYFWIGVGTMLAMGIDSYQKRDMILLFLLTPLSFTAPTFFILENAPKIIQIIAVFNPLTYQMEVMRAAAFSICPGIMIVKLFSISALMLFLAAYFVSKAKLRTSDET